MFAQLRHEKLASVLSVWYPGSVPEAIGKIFPELLRLGI